MNNIKYVLLLLFIFLLGMLAADVETAPEETKQEKSTDTKKYHSEDGLYTIVLPQDWEVKAGFMGMDVIALSEVDSPEDQFRENVNVIFADLDEPITEEEYYKQNVALLQKLLTDYNLQGEGDGKINGVDAKWIQYTHRMGDVEAAVLQYLFLNGNRAYVITFTANPEEYPKYESTFKEIVDSFTFDKQQ